MCPHCVPGTAGRGLTWVPARAIVRISISSYELVISQYEICKGGRFGRPRGRKEVPVTDRTLAGGLQVATCLHAFLAEEALPAAGIDPAGFWEGVARDLRGPHAGEPGAAGAAG